MSVEGDWEIHPLPKSSQWLRRNEHFMAIEIEVDVYVESARELNGYIVIVQKLISTGLMEFAGRLGGQTHGGDVIPIRIEL